MSRYCTTSNDGVGEIASISHGIWAESHSRTRLQRQQIRTKQKQIYQRKPNKPHYFPPLTKFWMLELCEDSQAATRALLPHQINLVLVAVVDFELGRRGGGLGEHFALA